MLKQKERKKKNFCALFGDMILVYDGSMPNSTHISPSSSQHQSSTELMIQELQYYPNESTFRNLVFKFLHYPEFK